MRCDFCQRSFNPDRVRPSTMLCLLCDTVRLAADERVLVLNSASDPFVTVAARHASQNNTNGTGTLVLAEDHVVSMETQTPSFLPAVQRVTFYDYASHNPPATMDLAVMNLLYQPGQDWIAHALHIAAYALRPGGYLYVQGAKDRGILSTAKRMEEFFGNAETLVISKGQRVIRSRRGTNAPVEREPVPPTALLFADGKLDEGTRLLLASLEVKPTDEALDIGCGAGYIGLHIARLATGGCVTMVDASLVAVHAARQAVAQSGLTNVRVLPGDGVESVRDERFDLVATNPPFHQGGIHTTSIAARFIHGAAHVLRPHGRFYLVANRFLKYEPTLHAAFRTVEEVGGDNRFKVLRATGPL